MTKVSPQAIGPPGWQVSSQRDVVIADHAVAGHGADQPETLAPDRAKQLIECVTFHQVAHLFKVRAAVGEA
jgi:hypothetical protein